MRLWDTCSRTAKFAVMLVGVALLPSAVTAKVYMTQEEALAVAFPGKSDVRRQTAFLTDDQAALIEKKSGQELSSKIVVFYTAGGRTAYFDTHLVRTLAETVMVVVSDQATIERVDILSFDEPEDYLPRDIWIQQLEGKKLDEELSLRKSIRPITGATLSGRALVSASRRVLAVHEVLGAAGEKQDVEPEEKSKGEGEE